MFYQKRQQKRGLAIRPGHSGGLRLQIRKRRASRGHSPAGSGDDHLEMRILTGGGTTTIQLTSHGNKPEMTIKIKRLTIITFYTVSVILIFSMFDLTILTWCIGIQCSNSHSFKLINNEKRIKCIRFESFVKI